MKFIHSSFIRNLWISATPTLLSVHHSTYTAHTYTSLACVDYLTLSLTYSHVLDETRMNIQQTSNLVSILLILLCLRNYCFLWDRYKSRKKLASNIIWRKWSTRVMKKLYTVGSSHPEMFCKKGFLKFFAKFTGK